MQVLQHFGLASLHQVIRDHLGNFGVPQIERTRARHIQEPIKNGEGPTVRQILGTNRPIFPEDCRQVAK